MDLLFPSIVSSIANAGETSSSEEHGRCSETAPKMFLEFSIPILNIWIFTVIQKVLCTLQNAHSRKVNYESPAGGENQNVLHEISRALPDCTIRGALVDSETSYYYLHNKTLTLNKKRRKGQRDLV